MRRFRTTVAAVLAFPLGMGIAIASVFPDVPDDHMHRKEIEALVSAGVIGGNPDGTFRPGDPVNRAAFLKMLYKANGKVPDSSSVRCFKDVVPESWYESFVCDAAVNGFVGGYPDKTFRPDQAVNRVEALKMIMMVFDIGAEEIDAAAKDIVKFVDVSTSAWYTKYLYAAFTKGILPIAGQGGARFYPEKPLLRSEAAAYIFNAINAELNAERNPERSSSSSESVSSAEEQGEEGEEEAAGSESSAAGGVAVEFPFEMSGKFSGKSPYAYTFEIDSPLTAYTEVQLSAGAGKVSCRLYLLGAEGFSDQYFLGHQEGSSCYLHTTLNPGSYQLQLQPTTADATFTVKSAVKKGDGNDGFRDASRLYKRTPQTAVLDVNDLHDWYSFVLTGQESLTVEITNGLELQCVVYAMNDVDLFGFSGPECNQSYNYPPGTYYVAVSRSIASKTARKTYTVQLR